MSSFINSEIFNSWLSTFLSIIVESLPFILIGSIISAIIQLFLKEETIKKFLPKNKIISIILASLMGLFLPLCECAIVPIGRSLIKKGVSVGTATTFMLAVPIINPIVLLSTYYAFSNNLSIVFLRAFGGLFISILIGLILEILTKKTQVIKNDTDYLSSCDCGCENLYIKSNFFTNVKNLIDHTSKEFLDISRYFILGAFLAGIVSVAMGSLNIDFKNIMPSMGIIVMLLLTFFLSLCSEADAFVAKGFLSSFGNSGVIAFLILGPMLDLKNVILLLGAFKKKYVFSLMFLTCSIVALFSYLVLFFGL
ncbi:permease [Clostridium gasigenes]|uniref:Permease n=1 Tax=Clostridium gasigenes TaxID=94869 RepID=A0A7X0SCZ5_9CLOT|nr:permease [Clostridium gasigenes]MBB6713962.1 permease [Clostridium gasigenes]